MPFKNSTERAACWAQENREIAAGYKSRWSCHEFAHDKKAGPKNPHFQSEAIPLSKEEQKIHRGANGGEYRLVDGKKHYSHSFKNPNAAETRKLSNKRSPAQHLEELYGKGEEGHRRRSLRAAEMAEMKQDGDSEEPELEGSCEEDYYMEGEKQRKKRSRKVSAKKPHLVLRSGRKV